MSAGGSSAARQVLPVGMVSTCIGCGCDDTHGCPTGCQWLRVDRESGDGICSECGNLVEAWDHNARRGKALRPAHG